MAFNRKEFGRNKGWKHSIAASKRNVAIQSTTDDRTVTYVELENILDINKDADLLVSDELKEHCWRLWWLKNYWGCWKHFFEPHITLETKL